MNMTDDQGSWTTIHATTSVNMSGVGSRGGCAGVVLEADKRRQINGTGLILGKTAATGEMTNAEGHPVAAQYTEHVPKK
jgi:hypothetical protein